MTPEAFCNLALTDLISLSPPLTHTLVCLLTVPPLYIVTGSYRSLVYESLFLSPSESYFCSPASLP